LILYPPYNGRPFATGFSATMHLPDAGLIIFAYLLGSLSTAIIVSRIMGLPDPRTFGSKNPGATNVLRTGNRKAAALALLGDMLKGLLPVLLGVVLQMPPLTLALIGMAAFLGHLYPLFFGFQGGKGVATALGVILAISWPVATAALVIWLIVAKIFRISSLAALIAAVATPALAWWLDPQLEWLVLFLLLALILVWRHRSNIQKLLNGGEDRIKG
jgi:acyl phosphate:glycerol-3-phosphate acyltransferase